MNIGDYLNVLPEEVLAHGLFCVTRKGDKQPYDPFLEKPVSARDKFYSIFELLDLTTINSYDTIGLKVGNGISVIDIDDCIDDSGELSAVALEIIHYVKSYTELSPGGRGIRILFKAKTPYDFNIYKTKNAKIDVEYYDADDQEQRGARMCRLSGIRLFDYKYREADTFEILEKYFKRPDRPKSTLSEDEPDYEWCKVVKFLIDHRLDLKPFLNRDLDSDESTSDYAICNTIAEYTTNVNEIKTVFEMTEYYRTKGIKSKRPKHKDKWDSAYGWNTVMSVKPSVVLFSNDRERTDAGDDIDKKIAVAIKYGITKQSYFKDIKIENFNIPKSEEIDILYWFAELNLRRLKLKEYLYDQIRNKHRRN